MAPKVTFIVPCYNLAHLLAECVNSILSQTYSDFEVLIMDDCSPDSTLDVARSFVDPRVIHVRNETNIRHLANYNKGIDLARGEYVWLISADDRLRRSYVLERYVRLMDDHPEFGFVFCPAMALQNGEETEIVQWSFHGLQDTVFKKHDLLDRLLHSNCVSAPCGMVRKECYELERFPLDMPYAGDWYLWSLFALHYDVAYLCEPMINYRQHGLSFTNFFMEDGIKENIADEVEVRWRIMKKAESCGYKSIVLRCKNHIVDDYVRRIQSKTESNHPQGLSVQEFEQSLISHAKNRKYEKDIRARVYYGLADSLYWKFEYSDALSNYKKTLQENPRMLIAWIKFVFLLMGRIGVVLRNTLSFINRNFNMLRYAKQALKWRRLLRQVYKQ